MNIFEKAVREKVRFASSRGLLGVEDLFDLPLQHRNGVDLDSVAREVNRALKAVTEDSFVSTASNPAKAAHEFKLEIVKHVIKVKQAEAEAASAAADKAEKKKKLVALLAEKQDEALSKLSTEEILKQIAELG